MTLFKREAEEKLKLIKNNKQRVFIIHYSCESFIKHSQKTPRISSIAIRNYDTAQTYSFSISKVAEVENKPIEMLKECYDEWEMKMLDGYFLFLK